MLDDCQIASIAGIGTHQSNEINLHWIRVWDSSMFDGSDLSARGAKFRSKAVYGSLYSLETALSRRSKKYPFIKIKPSV